MFRESLIYFAKYIKHNAFKDENKSYNITLPKYFLGKFVPWFEINRFIILIIFFNYIWTI